MTNDTIARLGCLLMLTIILVACSGLLTVWVGDEEVTQTLQLQYPSEVSAKVIAHELHRSKKCSRARLRGVSDESRDGTCWEAGVTFAYSGEGTCAATSPSIPGTYSEGLAMTIVLERYSIGSSRAIYLSPNGKCYLDAPPFLPICVFAVVLCYLLTFMRGWELCFLREA